MISLEPDEAKEDAVIFKKPDIDCVDNNAVLTVDLVTCLLIETFMGLVTSGCVVSLMAENKTRMNEFISVLL